jgi:hypothetical protein
MDEIVTRGAHIHAVSSYLLRFDEPPPAPQSGADGLFGLSAPTMNFLEAPTDLLDFSDHESAAEITEEAADAHAAPGMFEEELAAALQNQQAAHEEALRNARAEWVQQEGELLGKRLVDTLTRAMEDLRSDVGRILAPFVAREIEEMARDELIDLARRALADEEDTAIRLHGPKDLIDRVSRELASQSVVVNLVEADTVDVTIDLSRTKLETRLDAWMRRLCDSRSKS